MSKSNAVLLLTVSAIAVATAASAQNEPDKAKKPGIETVVVTAEKRVEDLQRVPVAVSAYSRDQRELLGITSINDLSKFTPGVQWEFPSPNRITIRGIGRQTGSLGTDPGVAAYYDGFYAGDPGSIAGEAGSSIGAPIFVDRVEVLRGPQGTLYGRNSIGGAINSVGLRASDTFEGQFEASALNYDVLEAQGTVSGPITDWLRYRVEGGYDYKGFGFVHNVGGREVDTRHSWNLSTEFGFDITHDLTGWVRWSTQTFAWTFTPSVRVDPYDTTHRQIGTIPNPTYAYATPNPGVADHRKVSLNDAGYLRLRNDNQIVAHLDWDLGSTGLHYVGGFQHYLVPVELDGDNSNRLSYILTAGPRCSVTPCFVASDLHTFVGEKHEQWSNELNWSSNGAGPWRWILGVFQFHERVHQVLSLRDPGQPEILTPFSFATFGFTANPTGEYVGIRSKLTTSAYAVYGQTDYDLSDEWTVQLGGRYSVDHKVGDQALDLVFYNPNDPAPFGFLPPDTAVFLPLGAPEVRKSWNGWTGRSAIQWKPNDNTMLYASLSTGFKAGGFNLGSLSTKPVRSEHVLTYELGAKTTIADDLRIDAALFLNDYRNLQVPVTLCLTSGGVPSSNPADCATRISTLVNAPRSRTWGFEAEATYKASDDLQFILNFAHLDTEFRKFCCVVDLTNVGAGGQDLKGSSLPFSPENKVAFNVLYRWRFDPGSLALSGTYSWVDSQFASIFNTSIFRERSRQTVDLRATWTPASEDWTAQAFVENLFDAQYNTGISIASPGTDNGRSWSLGPPRQFGVKVGYHLH